MKKLLSIIVLGLLWCSTGFSDISDKDLELIISNQENKRWVVDNWGGVIKVKWPTLSKNLTDLLNETFNE